MEEHMAVYFKNSFKTFQRFDYPVKSTFYKGNKALFCTHQNCLKGAAPPQLPLPGEEGWKELMKAVKSPYLKPLIEIKKLNRSLGNQGNAKEIPWSEIKLDK